MPPRDADGFTSRNVVPGVNEITPDEADRLAGFISHLENRVEALESGLESSMKRVLAELLADKLPTKEERDYLQGATLLAAQRFKFRQSVIEKTTIGLVWGFLATTATVAWTMVTEYAKNHGWKP